MIQYYDDLIYSACEDDKKVVAEAKSMKNKIYHASFNGTEDDWTYIYHKFYSEVSPTLIKRKGTK